HGSIPDGICQQGGDEPRGIQLTVEWRPVRPDGIAHPGPALADLAGIEPVGPMPLLALGRDRVPQRLRFRVLARDPADALAPESDVDAGGLEQLGGKLAVPLTAGHAELVERLMLCRGDLRREHPRSRAPGLADLAPALQYQHAAATARQLPCAGRP